MAEQAEQPQTDEQSARKFPIKTVAILAAVFLVEALAISGAFMIAGKPADATGDAKAMEETQKLERPVEELVVEEKFQNTSTGRAYLYDTEIYIVIRAKHQEAVKAELEEKKARITTAISRIFRQADQVHLLEPTLATLTRQVEAEMDKIMKPDEKTKKSRVLNVLIRKCNQFRADL